jgi:chromosome segregation ATPase
MFAPSRDVVKMDADPAPFPKPLEEIQKLIKTPYTHVLRASLRPIRAGLNLEHERHGEILKEKEDKIWALQNQLQAERIEKDQRQREIENIKAEKEVLREKVDRMALESNEHKRDVKLQKTLRASSAVRCSRLMEEITELKEKGKRAASALMSTAKELEEGAPPSKKTKTLSSSDEWVY